MNAGRDGDRGATTVPPRAGTRWANIAPRSRTSSGGEREWGRSALAASRDPKAPPRDPSAEPTPGVASPRLSPAPPSNPPSKEPPPGTRSPFLRAIRCSPQGWALPIVLMGEKGGFIVLWDGEEGGLIVLHGGKGAPIVLRGLWGRSALLAGGVVDRRVGFAIVLQTEGGVHCPGWGSGAALLRRRRRSGGGAPWGEEGAHGSQGAMGGGHVSPEGGVCGGGEGGPIVRCRAQGGGRALPGVPVTLRPGEGVGRVVPIAPREGSAAPGGRNPERRGEGGGDTRTGMNEGRGRRERREGRRTAAQSRGSPRSARPAPTPIPAPTASALARPPRTPPGRTHTRAAQRGAAAGTATAAVEGPAWPAWGGGGGGVGARRCPQRRSAPTRPGKSRTSLSSPRSAKALNAALAPPRPARDRPRGAERHRSSGAAPVPALCPQCPPPLPPLRRGMRCARCPVPPRPVDGGEPSRPVPSRRDSALPPGHSRAPGAAPPAPHPRAVRWSPRGCFMGLVLFCGIFSP